MKLIVGEENTIIENVQDFNIEQTLECGQCFHFDKIAELEYVVISSGKLLHLKQKGKTLTFFNTIQDEVIDFWMNYFDLNRNYGEIKSFLLMNESVLHDAINEKYGVRILNQNFYEMIISFIISQNKNITHIKQIIKGLSLNYGECLGEVNGKLYYAFPSMKKLSELSEEDFRQCKTGFRAPYLVDAIAHIINGNLLAEELINMPIALAREKLLKVKGVGNKIANCVLLFGLGYREAFPVDVWIKRVMEDIYFKQETPIEEIQKLADTRFGKYGGYAQQYLFYYGRENKIGKIARK